MTYPTDAVRCSEKGPELALRSEGAGIIPDFPGIPAMGTTRNYVNKQSDFLTFPLPRGFSQAPFLSQSTSRCPSSPFIFDVNGYLR